MSDGETQQTPPRVFISYAQYEPAHSEQVLTLAHALATDGLDVELDQFHGHETVDWPRWCAERLEPENTDFVLTVCTAEYRRRIQGKVELDQGRGVFWEGSLIYGYLYREKANERFVPVLLDEEPESSLPPAVANWNHFRLRDFGLQSADQGYEDLYRLLTGQPATLKPTPGELVRLPPRPVPEVGGKTAGAPTKPTPTANETAARGTHQASPVPHRKKTHTEHQSLATRVFGGLLLVFLFAVFAFAPDPLPEYKHRILALCAALLAALFGWFLSGEIGLRIEGLKSRFGDLAIRATGGLALFVVVLAWWLSPLAPVGSGEDPVTVPELLRWGPLDGREAGICIDGCKEFIPWPELREEINQRLLPQEGKVRANSKAVLQDYAGRRDWIVRVVSATDKEIVHIWFGGDPENNWSHDGLIRIGTPNPLEVFGTYQRYSDGSYRKLSK